MGDFILVLTTCLPLNLKKQIRSYTQFYLSATCSPMMLLTKRHTTPVSFLSPLLMGGINRRLIKPCAASTCLLRRSRSCRRDTNWLGQQSTNRPRHRPWHREGAACQHIHSVCLITNSFLRRLVPLIPPQSIFPLRRLSAMSVFTIIFLTQRVYLDTNNLGGHNLKGGSWPRVFPKRRQRSRDVSGIKWAR